MSDVFQDFAEELTEGVSRGVALSDQEFGDLALELYQLQYLHVAPYGRFCDQLNRSPDDVTDWTQIPAVPVAAFKEFEMTSLPAADRAVVFLSSGTTGHPCSRHFHSAGSLSHYRRMTLPWFKVHVLPDFDRISLVSLIPAASAGRAAIASG